MKLAGGRQGWWAGWALGVLVFAACSGADEGPPPAKKPSANVQTEAVDLEVPRTCDDLASASEWEGGVCEKDGNGACGGVGEATSDCARCCPEAEPPSCEEVAKAKGWAGFTCEQGDGACGGLGEGSSDCEVCCEAPTAKPTCAQVAAEWGYEQAVCETGGNGACGGDGAVTSDCEHCCDAPTVNAEDKENGFAGDDPDAENPFEEMDPDLDLRESDEDTPYDPAVDDDFGDGMVTGEVDPGGSVPPPPPPLPACADVAASNGWAKPSCEYSGNNACQGQGPATQDCDHCCAGTGTPPATTGCGNGVCDGGETCDSCSKDCGKCLRVAEVNLAGADKKKLHQTAKALKALKPRAMVIGLQSADSEQRRYLAQQLGLTFAQPSLQSKQKGAVNGLLSVAPLKDTHAASLLGDGKLLRSALETKQGSLVFGSASVSSSGKLAVVKAANSVSAGFGLLAVHGGSPASQPYQTLQDLLTDGWSQAWGPGLTTDLREDQLFQTQGGLPPVKGQVVGAKSKLQHASVVMSHSPRAGAEAADKDEKGKITILTANIGRTYDEKGKNKQTMVDTIKKLHSFLEQKQGPRFVGWQEISEADPYGNTVEYATIQDVFKNGWELNRPKGERPDGKKEVIKVPIAAKGGGAPDEAHAEFASKGWADVSPTRFIAVVHYPDVNLTMLNTHFIAGAWSGKHHPQQRREYWSRAWKELRQLASKEHEAGHHVVITGDLNRARKRGKHNPKWDYTRVHPRARVVAGSGIDYIYAVPAKGYKFKTANKGSINMIIDGHNAHWVTGKFVARLGRGDQP